MLGNPRGVCVGFGVGGGVRPVVLISKSQRFVLAFIGRSGGFVVNTRNTRIYLSKFQIPNSNPIPIPHT